MMNMTRNLWLASLILSSPVLAAADVYVIAHPSAAISQADVRDVFLGDKQFAGATKLMPIDNGAAQEEFLGKALKMESGKYNSTWTKKSFREGLNPPAVKSGDLEVIEFVKRTAGAVGYVRSSPAGVTVVGRY